MIWTILQIKSCLSNKNASNIQKLGIFFYFQYKVTTGLCDVCNFVINEFNPTFEVQNIGNKAFQNACNPSF